ncbi:MAG: hypothetical protein ACXV39_10780 [Halobacteriota archaeon]
MEHLLSTIGAWGTHLLAGLSAALLTLWFVEPFLKRKRQEKELDKLSWLFPISQGNPEMHFNCSLKPRLHFKPLEKEEYLFSEFFGRNPPTYRRYTHSAEVLALQMITEKLSLLGVRFLHAGFYGGTEPSGNLLLIGSESNTELSSTILAFLRKRIDRVEPPQGGHKYFKCGEHEYKCAHTEEIDGLSRVTQDYGVIVRRTLSDGRIVLLLAGIHMHGTLAAAQVALNKAFQQRVIQHKYDNFAQLVHVNVLGDGTSIDVNSLDDWKNLPFVNLD